MKAAYTVRFIRATTRLISNSRVGLSGRGLPVIYYNVRGLGEAAKIAAKTKLDELAIAMFMIAAHFMQQGRWSGALGPASKKRLQAKN